MVTSMASEKSTTTAVDTGTTPVNAPKSVKGKANPKAVAARASAKPKVKANTASHPLVKERAKATARAKAKVPQMVALHAEGRTVQVLDPVPRRVGLKERLCEAFAAYKW